MDFGNDTDIEFISSDENKSKQLVEFQKKDGYKVAI